jgi:hypothetical protein
VGRFPLNRVRPTTEIRSGPHEHTAQAMLQMSGPCRPSGPMGGRVWRDEYKGGQNGGAVRVNPNCTPRSSVTTPHLQSACAAWPCWRWWPIVTGSSPPPLGDLLRLRTLSTHPYSSTPLSLFLGHSPARLGRRVPRPGCSTFARWGGEVDEPMEHPAVAWTLEIRRRRRVRRVCLIW